MKYKKGDVYNRDYQLIDDEGDHFDTHHLSGTIVYSDENTFIVFAEQGTNAEILDNFALRFKDCKNLFKHWDLNQETFKKLVNRKDVFNETKQNEDNFLSIEWNHFVPLNQHTEGFLFDQYSPLQLYDEGNQIGLYKMGARVELIERLKNRYHYYLNEDLKSVVFYMKNEDSYFDIVFSSKDDIIITEKIDIDWIDFGTGKDEPDNLNYRNIDIIVNDLNVFVMIAPNGIFKQLTGEYIKFWNQTNNLNID